MFKYIIADINLQENYGPPLPGRTGWENTCIISK